LRWRSISDGKEAPEAARPQAAAGKRSAERRPRRRILKGSAATGREELPPQSARGKFCVAGAEKGFAGARHSHIQQRVDAHERG
jgi:hypothetical protein